MLEINTKSPEYLLKQIIKRLGHGYDSIFLSQENHIISRPNLKSFFEKKFLYKEMDINNDERKLLWIISKVG